MKFIMLSCASNPKRQVILKPKDIVRAVEQEETDFFSYAPEVSEIIRFLWIFSKKKVISPRMPQYVTKKYTAVQLTDGSSIFVAESASIIQDLLRLC
jgi:hypothetical protein